MNLWEWLKRQWTIYTCEHDDVELTVSSLGPGEAVRRCRKCGYTWKGRVSP